MPFIDLPAWLLPAVLITAQVLGVLSALHAIMHTRTPQGATAWVIALLLLPVVTLPFYWTFGSTKFDTYAETIQDFERKMEQRSETHEIGSEYLVDPSGERGEVRAFSEMATLPLTCKNGGRLLVDGHKTFEAIFAALDRAEDYILAQFYIIHDDQIGTAFKEKLIAAAGRGVRVYLLYDGVGSAKLPRSYKRALKEHGVEVSSFSSGNWLERFRLNFRNHRKIVVVDGIWAALGGHNVGDEYLGRDETLSPWRDTHVAVEGPLVQGAQLSFLRDWFYATEELLDVEWTPTPSDEDRDALLLASGPADDLETCGLLYTHAIESAEERVWIATPYFVPDGRVLAALQLAALRGVDVRIMMPRQTDSFIFKFVPYTYLPEIERAGVKTYLYEEGFMHQKILLVDDDYAAVSSANFDNRSFRLNFEITVLFCDARFAGDLEAMLEADFARATQITQQDLDDKSYAFRVAAQAGRLLSPIL